jgi:hypothetical protein
LSERITGLADEGTGAQQSERGSATGLAAQWAQGHDFPLVRLTHASGIVALG